MTLSSSGLDAMDKSLEDDPTYSRTLLRYQADTNLLDMLV